jgi:hypothetical protein
MEKIEQIIGHVHVGDVEDGFTLNSPSFATRDTTI